MRDNLTINEARKLERMLLDVGMDVPEEVTRILAIDRGNKVDKEYFRLLNLILREGRTRKNRTGVDTVGVFGAQSKFKVDLDAFPVLTTKKMFLKGIIHELLWFIKGDTNIKYLVDNGVHIWDEWAYKRYFDYYTEFGFPKQCDIIPENSKELECDADALFTPYTQERFIHRIKNDADFAKKWGGLGEGTYGSMWRAFPYHDCELIDPQVSYVDQLGKVIEKLKTNPDDRRMIVSAWHPYWVDHCALPPCHCLFQFHTSEIFFNKRIEFIDNSDFEITMKNIHDEYEDTLKDKRDWDYNEFEQYAMSKMDEMNVPKYELNLLLYQRSCDTFLGVPFNITSYSLLLAIVAHCVNMIPGTFTHTYGDLHIYENHRDQVKTQLERIPMKLPKLYINPDVRNITDIKYEDIQILDYESHPTIKAPIAV